MHPFTFRAASQGDFEVAYEITKDAMQKYVVMTWGQWNEQEQREKHRNNYMAASHRIIEIDHLPGGILAVEQEPSYVWLVKLYLLRKYRGAGIGTAVLQTVIEEAEAIPKPLRLRVLRVNERAQRLYARRGFRTVGEEPDRLFMVRPSGGA